MSMLSIKSFIIQIVKRSQLGDRLFSDSIDRLYIVYDTFDLENIFSNEAVEAVHGVIAMYDKDVKRKVSHFKYNSKIIWLIWRTVFQDVAMDSSANGFRIFVYPSGESITNIIILYINKHLLIGLDAFPLESIKLHIAWFAGRDVAKHMARGNIAWLTGSEVRTSNNFTESIRNVNGFYGIEWQEMHIIHLFYNKTIVDLCFGGHGVFLNSKLNHIDLRSASVNMTFSVQ